jgi:hypothetical protein
VRVQADRRVPSTSARIFALSVLPTPALDEERLLKRQDELTVANASPMMNTVAEAGAERGGIHLDASRISSTGRDYADFFWFHGSPGWLLSIMQRVAE